MRRPLILLSTLSTAVATACAFLIACSSDSSSPAPGPKPDGGGTVDSAGGGTDSATPTDSGGQEAAAALVSDCTGYVDRSAPAASRSLQWDINVGAVPERCMKIKVGQTIKWANGAGVADFAEHPLLIFVPPPKAGTAPMVNETTGEATFPNAGTFGFGCNIHPQMNGAVEVVP